KKPNDPRHGTALDLLARAGVDPNLKPEVMAACTPLLDQSGFLRDRAAHALAHWADAGDRTLLLRLLNDQQSEVADAGFEALVRLKDVPALVSVTSDPAFNPGIIQRRNAALAALAKLKDPRGAQAAATLLSNAFHWQQAQTALEQMGPVAEK